MGEDVAFASESNIMRDFTEKEIVPISAISHYLYCPRQNALIHTEGVFLDNDLTISGNIGHSFVDEEKSYEDHGVHKETSLRVYSERYGVSGIADIIEFPQNSAPFPIDYKNGRIASWKNQEAQLCAIALCLEEMLGTAVPSGAIYHIQSRKRHTVHFSEELRTLTIEAIEKIRAALLANSVPPAKPGKKCRRCSLQSLCLPTLSDAAIDAIFQPAASEQRISRHDRKRESSKSRK